MNKLLIFTLSVFFQLSSIIGFSQTIKWGQQYERKENNKVVSMKEYLERKIIGWDETGFYLYVIENQSDLVVSLYPILEKYDYNLNLLYAKKLGFPKADGTVDPWDVTSSEQALDIQIVNQTPVVTFSVLNPDTKEITISTLVLDDKGQISKNITNQIKIPGGRKSHAYSWDARLSGDSSKLGVFTYSHMTEKDFAFIQCKILDDKTNTLVDETFHIKYDYSTITFERFCIDNNNNIHILASFPKSKNNQFKLFSYYPKDKKLVESEINNTTTYISNITILSPATGLPLVCGFSGDAAKEEATGFFIKKVGASSSETTKLEYKKFDKVFLSEVLEAKKVEKKPYLKDLIIKDLIKAPDNSYYILAEQECQEPRQRVSVGMSVGTVYYVYTGSIIIVNTDTSGSIKWMHGIYKNQDKELKYASSLQGRAQAMANYDAIRSIDHMSFYSYAYYLNKGNLQLLYNDHLKNKNITSPDELKTLSNGDDYNPVVVTFSPNGTYKKEVITIEEDYNFRPKLSFYYPKEGIITFRRSKKLYKFGKLTLK